MYSERIYVMTIGKFHVAMIERTLETQTGETFALRTEFGWATVAGTALYGIIRIFGNGLAGTEQRAMLAGIIAVGIGTVIDIIRFVFVRQWRRGKLKRVLWYHNISKVHYTERIYFFSAGKNKDIPVRWEL